MEERHQSGWGGASDAGDGSWGTLSEEASGTWRWGTRGDETQVHVHVHVFRAGVGSGSLGASLR